MIRRLLFAFVAVLALAEVASAQPNLAYSCARDHQGVPIFCRGVSPTVTAEMGIPPGTPFYDTTTFKLYYWSGSAWAATAISGTPGSSLSIFSATPGRLTFEGATEDAYETEFSATDPTADRLITIPDATGTMMVENAFNLSIPDSGDGSAAAYTFQPAGYSVATLACADAHGCNVTLGETGVAAGARLTIVRIAAGSGAVVIVDDDGTTSELDGDTNLSLDLLDSVTLVYTGSYWVQVGYLDIS